MFEFMTRLGITRHGTPGFNILLLFKMHPDALCFALVVVLLSSFIQLLLIETVFTSIHLMLTPEAEHLPSERERIATSPAFVIHSISPGYPAGSAL